jgi:hypothetical protein
MLETFAQQIDLLNFVFDGCTIVEKALLDLRMRTVKCLSIRRLKDFPLTALLRAYPDLTALRIHNCDSVDNNTLVTVSKLRLNMVSFSQTTIPLIPLIDFSATLTEIIADDGRWEELSLTKFLETDFNAEHPFVTHSVKNA